MCRALYWALSWEKIQKKKKTNKTKQKKKIGRKEEKRKEEKKKIKKGKTWSLLQRSLQSNTRQKYIHMK